MKKTKIDWCDSTWNPVTGCLHGCEYCYARGIANRYGGANDGEVDYEGEALWTFEGEETGGNHILDSPLNWYSDDGGTSRKAPYPYYFDPTFHRYRLDEPRHWALEKPRNIFVCSMADLFGEWVPDEWILEVLKACDQAPQHNYLFLTKNPGRYVNLSLDGKLPKNKNMWYGVTVTNKEQALEAEATMQDMSDETGAFLSIEPIMEDISKEIGITVANFADWVIIGAETGRRKAKVVPKREWIERIVIGCQKNGIPLFMKSNLTDIWGEDLIQEYPLGLMGGKE